MPGIFGWLRLAFNDPEIDYRVKLTDLSLRMTAPLLFKNGRVDRNLITKMNGPVPIRLKAGVNAVDIELPAAEQSCYEGTTKATVKARLYYAEGVTEKRPIVIYFHAGGLTLGGGMDRNSDTISRNLVKTGKVVALSVDYRLAPEHLVPEAIDDSISSVLWVHQGDDPTLKQYADTSKIVLLGDSAGAYLSAVLSYYLLKNYPQISIALQVLVYPPMNMTETTSSKKQFHNAYISNPEFIKFFRDSHYPKTPEFQESPLYRPLNALSFQGMPPTHIILADRDALLDEGKMYYERLVQDGVKASIKVYEHTTHGFFTFIYLPQNQQCWKDIGVILNENLQ